MGRPKGFSREEVLNKVIQVFWKKGFSKSCLHDLEKATGVNKSGLYSEFSSKDEIFFEGLKHYAEKSGVLELLARQPLGLGNIEDFLLLGDKASGQKGCLMANSIREMSIIPPKAKQLILAHIAQVREALLNNLKATHLKGNHEQMASLILTFNSGLCLSLNLTTKENIQDQVRDFLELLRKI